MSKIVIAGGTGYAGSAITAEAAARGHAVTVYSRKAPATPVAGVTYKQGSLREASVREAVVGGADVIISTLSPRGDSAGTLLEINTALGQLAASQGKRLIIVGGFSSLRPAPGAPRFATGEIPKEYAAEAREMNGLLESLLSSAPAGLDWVFVSPAMVFGSFAPGQRTGSYKVGDDVAVFDAKGQTSISGADFAIGVVDEADKPKHHRAHISLYS